MPRARWKMNQLPYNCATSSCRLFRRKISVLQILHRGSSALEAKAVLGAGVKLFRLSQRKGSQAAGAAKGSIVTDLWFGDDKASRDPVIALAEAAGARGIDGGVLVNSVAANGGHSNPTALIPGGSCDE
jgi:predicted dinucleotide-binding enzyme